ncbi:MAG: acetyl-CoA carboxylase biotin carboxyl carrier protein [Woeseia sp.]
MAEIEIKEGEESVRISRYAQGAAPAVSMAPQPAMQAPQPAHAASPAPSATPAAPAEPEETGHKVKAPMVGTFYSSSSPGSPPFVQVGDSIKAGDTLCIVEAMKMMNQIESEVSGVIKSVRVQNGDPVEYGQVLFVIDQRGGE